MEFAMFKHAPLILVLLVSCAVPSSAQLQKFCIPGIAPSRHVTSLELTPATMVINNSGGVSLDTLTAKMYYTFNPDYNIGIEVPLARYESPDKSVNGLGDVLLSAQAVHSVHRIDWGVKMETYLPTAGDELLGSGKLIVSPSVFAVYPFNSHFFIAAGYKQYFSVAGDGGRDDVNYSRFRLLVSYMDENQWWVTFDPQYYVDYKNWGQAELIWESELGMMINPGTAVYLKPGAHLGGNWQTRDWTLGIGFKILYL